MKKLSKKDTEEKIKTFFSNPKNKSPKEVKKIKKASMSHNIKLGEKRKSFCRKCLSPYSGKEKIRISNGMKSVKCENCGAINRWKIKLS